VSVLKRVAQVLTPPPFRKSRTPLPVSPTPSYADPTQDFTARLHQLLKKLVTMPASEVESRQQLVAQIRSLGGEKGRYATAGAIRVQLDALTSRPVEGVTYYPAEGYRLAADLILQQVLKEIDAVRSSSSPLGPNILAIHCNDLNGDLIEARDIRHAVEVPVMITDRLLWHAMHSADRKPAFLALASPAITSARDLLEQRLRRLEREQREEAVRRRRRKRESRLGAGAAEEAETRTPEISALSRYVDFLSRYHGQLSQICAAFLAYAGVPTVAPGQRDPGRVPGHCRYLQGLHQFAASVGYAGFQAMIQEEAGALMAQVNRDQGARLLRQAAYDYDVQGDAEKGVGLRNLAKMRFTKACQLYGKLGDQAAVTRVQSKLEAR